MDDACTHTNAAIDALKQAYAAAKVDSRYNQLVLCVMRRQLRELQSLRIRMGALQ